MNKKQFAEHWDIIVFEDGVRARVVNNLDYEEKLDLKEIDSNEIMTSNFLTDDLQLGKIAWHRGMHQSKIIKIIDGGWLNKSYTFDEAKKDCEENGTRYLNFYSEIDKCNYCFEMYNVYGNVRIKSLNGQTTVPINCEWVIK